MGTADIITMIEGIFGLICLILYLYSKWRVRREIEFNKELIEGLKDMTAFANALINIYERETNLDPHIFIDKAQKLKKKILEEGTFIIER